MSVCVGGVKQLPCPHGKRRKPMRMFEYVCRCGKRSDSLFEHKRHVKCLCSLKHVPVETTGKSVRIVGPANTKDKK